MIGALRASARVAGFLAYQRTGLAWWRRISITVAGLLLALATGLVISLASAASHRQNVSMDRQPIVVPGEKAGLRMLEYGPIIAGRQMPIYWVDAEAPDAPVPPGLARLPNPGTIVVSPGLARLGGDELEAKLGLPLATDSDGPVLIGEAGLAGANELLAYARPPVGRRINSEWAVNVADFGSRGPRSHVGGGYEPDGPTGLAGGAFALGVVPVLYLLWVAVGAGIGARNARLGILHELGASRRTLAVTSFLEAVFQAGPGVVAGSALWYLAATRFAGIPQAGIGFFAGDMRVGWPWAFLVAILVIVASGAMAVVQAIRQPTTQGSPTYSRALTVTGRRARIGALAIVGGLLVAAHLSNYPDSSRYWYLAFVAAVVTQPFVLPIVVEAVGRRVARRLDPQWWLVGERMVHSPARLARPAFALVGLVLVAAVGTAASAVVWSANAAPGYDPPVISLGWSDPHDGDVASIRRSLPEATVLTVKSDSNGASTLGALSCADLVALVVSPNCDSDTVELASQRLAEITQGGQVAGALVVGPNGADATPVNQVLIVGAKGLSGRQLYAKVLPVAHRQLGMSNLNGGNFLQFSETSRRVGAGVAVAAMVLLLSALVLMGDRSLLLGQEDYALELVGASNADQRRLRYLQVAIPALLATITGGVVAIAFVWVGAEMDTKPETVFLWLPILGEISLVSALALALAFVVSRVRPAPSSPP